MVNKELKNLIKQVLKETKIIGPAPKVFRDYLKSGEYKPLWYTIKIPEGDILLKIYGKKGLKERVTVQVGTNNRQYAIKLLKKLNNNYEHVGGYCRGCYASVLKYNGIYIIAAFQINNEMDLRHLIGVLS